MLNVVLLADGGPGVGLGHLRRCFVLGRALAAQGASVLVASPAPEAAEAAAAAGFGVAPFDVASARAADIAVVDGYDIGPDQTAPLMARGTFVVQIDDLGDREVAADLVVNPNGYASDVRYGPPALCGLRYSLVDPAYATLRDVPRPYGFLVSFGGAHDGTIALAVAAELAARVHGAGIHAVVPEPVDATPAAGVAVHVRPDMLELMRRTAVYVGAAGGTAYEAVAAGLAVVTCSVTGNQDENAEYLRRVGATVVSAVDPVLLATAAAEAPRGPLPSTIDGRGPARIAAVIMGELTQRDRGRVSDA